MEACFEPAPTTGAGAASAGVAIFVRKFVAMDNIRTIVPGRCIVARVATGPRGGVTVASLYLRDTVGPRHEDNWESLCKVGVTLAQSPVPWLVLGDWNTHPRELNDAGWLELAAGCAIAPPDSVGTCRTARGTWSVLDYIVVDGRLAGSLGPAVVEMDADTRPHRPVCYRIAAHARSRLIRQQLQPRRFPREPPALPALPPPDWPSWDPPKFNGLSRVQMGEAVDSIAKFVLAGIEEELITAYNISQEQDSAYRGRGDPPVYHMVPELGTTVTAGDFRLDARGRWGARVERLSASRRRLRGRRRRGRVQVPGEASSLRCGNTCGDGWRLRRPGPRLVRSARPGTWRSWTRLGGDSSSRRRRRGYGSGLNSSLRCDSSQRQLSERRLRTGTGGWRELFVQVAARHSPWSGLRDR
jgi:hypothetical protein